MGVQEVIALAIVAGAGWFTIRKIIGQFAHSEHAAECGKCELKNAMEVSNLSQKEAPESAPMTAGREESRS